MWTSSSEGFRSFFLLPGRNFFMGRGLLLESWSSETFNLKQTHTHTYSHTHTQTHTHTATHTCKAKTSNQTECKLTGTRIPHEQTTSRNKIPSTNKAASMWWWLWSKRPSNPSVLIWILPDRKQKHGEKPNSSLFMSNNICFQSQGKEVKMFFIIVTLLLHLFQTTAACLWRFPPMRTLKRRWVVKQTADVLMLIWKCGANLWLIPVIFLLNFTLCHWFHEKEKLRRARNRENRETTHSWCILTRNHRSYRSLEPVKLRVPVNSAEQGIFPY